MTTELKERLVNEPKTIGILGAIGSGKSTLSRILSEKLGIERIEEKFPLNPYLNDFYEDPKRSSFDYQFWFLMNTVDQVASVGQGKSVILDPANEMNYLYAKTHLDMGWMTQKEFNIYFDAYSLMQEKNRKWKPDLFLRLNPDIEVLKKRIKNRARPYELLMLNKYPEYLVKLSRNVKSYIGGNVLPVNTSKDNYIDEDHINGLIQIIKRNI